NCTRAGGPSQRGFRPTVPANRGYGTSAAAFATVRLTPQASGRPTHSHAATSHGSIPVGTGPRTCPAVADAAWAAGPPPPPPKTQLPTAPTAKRPAIRYRVTSYASLGGTPAAIRSARKWFTSIGPAMPAQDQAVSTRPWIAPTWVVPNRSRRYAGMVANPP